MKFHLWYFLFLIFFAALGIAGYLWLAANDLLVHQISLGDFLLIALAISRLIRLFSYDIVTNFIRNWFVDENPNSFRGTLGTLINCPWCTGLWFSLVTVFFYFATPVAWYAILVLALSTCASLIQILANFIGHSAELKKRQLQSNGF